MKIGLLSVGTEILLGDTINTNLSKLGSLLYESGNSLTHEITVSDKKQEIENGFKFLIDSCDVVITCGGLGPTEDDITREVIANYLDIDLKLDKAHVDFMKKRWQARGLMMPETNLKQAYLPVNSIKLENTQGTAPGSLLEIEDKKIYILPGPPREFIPLVQDELIPRIINLSDDIKKDYQFIIFYNQAESSLAQEINKFKPSNIDIAYLASKGIIKLRYDKNSISEEEESLFTKNITQVFETDIIAYENVDISKILLNLLLEKEITVSFVESVTGGELSSKLTKNPGSSTAFIGSSIVYTKQAKKLLLDTDEKLNNWQLLAERLADNALSHYKSDITLAILGEAGPISSSKYGIGEIFINISDKHNSISTTHKLNGNREEVIQRAVNKSIWELINFVKNLY
ncbi:molybdopterin-binding protein [Acidimicrobiia bacterium]|nr:molybdopterin-binding protein [Acidimicrobiia bacterium]